MEKHAIKAKAERNQPAPRRLAPPRFKAFVVILVAGTVAASLMLGWQHGLLVGFDVAALAFLVSVVPLLKAYGADAMRRHARDNDANAVLHLAITAAVMLVILAAVAIELGQREVLKLPVTGLVIGTLALAWLFSNTVYALHYAHIYYLDRNDDGVDDGGINFPGTDEPQYWDFIYFAFTLGMTFQTSDTEITSASLRKTVVLHCLAAFVFNIGVLAFSINVLGSTT